MAALAHGDVVIIPAVDRLSRDTTDLLIIAREMQKAAAGTGVCRMANSAAFNRPAG
jgi:DNA invertase Pin-like site-specific DNA recombinase